ncbi:hypothetical protein Bbelb_116110 [Branchiostoma belcheri]|nr:hypothetical protein Bbelb_116110 [Branchiostoma belcheri]
MLSATWSRVVVGAVAGAALVGAAGYRRTVSAMPNWRERARHEAYKAAYNDAPVNYNQQLFEPNFNFPKTMPREDYRELPWMKIDYNERPEEYLNAVLDYCFEGNTECDFRVQQNKVRQWYSAPWLATGPFGREPIHGLTMERPADPGYLASEDKRWNSFGGYTIGQFWKHPAKPTLDRSVEFPAGTVAFKLLFTHATEEDIPALRGAKEWQAGIGVPKHPVPPTASRGAYLKALEEAMAPTYRGPDPYPLRLIQVDVMVRDPRSKIGTRDLREVRLIIPTLARDPRSKIGTRDLREVRLIIPTLARDPRSKIGWLFGSFMYDKDQPNPAHPGEDAWWRLVPMALQWGNDPNLTPDAYYNQGKRPKESWNNPRVKELKLLPKGRPFLGYLERANGIVDSFISSCASCHSTASILPPKPVSKPAATPGMEPDTMQWFRNVGCGEPFEEGVLSLDYSMQLNFGMKGLKGWLRDNPEPSGIGKMNDALTKSPDVGNVMTSIAHEKWREDGISHI